MLSLHALGLQPANNLTPKICNLYTLDMLHRSMHHIKMQKLLPNSTPAQRRTSTYVGTNFMNSSNRSKTGAGPLEGTSLMSPLYSFLMLGTCKHTHTHTQTLINYLCRGVCNCDVILDCGSCVCCSCLGCKICETGAPITVNHLVNVCCVRVIQSEICEIGVPGELQTHLVNICFRSYCSNN